MPTSNKFDDTENFCWSVTHIKTNNKSGVDQFGEAMVYWELEGHNIEPDESFDDELAEPPQLPSDMKDMLIIVPLYYG